MPEDNEVLVLSPEDVVEASRISLQWKLQKFSQGAAIGASLSAAVMSGIVGAQGIENGNPWLFAAALAINALAAQGIHHATRGL
jgi:hypothetical protein